MSINSESDEIEDILDRTLDNLLRDNQSALPGAELRRQVGIVRANFIALMYSGEFGDQLLACFTAAFNTGMKLRSLVYVHEQLFLEEPKGAIATAMVQAAILFCLATEGRMIIKIEFTSRDDVETMMMETKATFDEARELAADNSDSAPYQALTFLAGALTQHLISTARPLPRMINFTMKVNFPAMTLSQRIYYDPTRWEELYAENKTIHPLFCQREIIGLSE